MRLAIDLSITGTIVLSRSGEPGGLLQRIAAAPKIAPLAALSASGAALQGVSVAPKIGALALDTIDGQALEGIVLEPKVGVPVVTSASGAALQGISVAPKIAALAEPSTGVLQGISVAPKVGALAELRMTSDDFRSGSLGPHWTFVDPLALGATATAQNDGTDWWAEITLPTEGVYDSYNADNNAAKLLQTFAADPGDFVLVARFLSTPTLHLQGQGFYVEQDSDDWLRFDRYMNSGTLRKFAGSTVAGVTTAWANAADSVSAQWLRLSRSGNQWSFMRSSDGTSWSTLIVNTRTLTVSKIGILAGATDTGNVVKVDYVEFASDPISGEDA